MKEKELAIGTIFKMQGNFWKVITYGRSGWVGIECQNHKRAFTSESVENVLKYLQDENPTL